MKLKYYLRGLGIGIIVTTVILMIASVGKKASMTDEEIVARARELGMVTAEEAAEKKQQETAQKLEKDQPKEDQSEENQPEKEKPKENQPEKEEPKEDQPEKDQPKEPEENQPEEQAQENTGQTDKENGQGAAAEPVMVTVEIKPGEYSDRISAKLLESGLITDAEDFNKYLTDTGVDSSIAVGQHQIPQGAAYEEIAKILCEKPENQ